MRKNKDKNHELSEVLDDSFSLWDEMLEKHQFQMTQREMGRVWKIGNGIARVKGLPNIRNEELIRFSGGEMGMAFNLDRDEIAAVFIDDYEGIKAGQPAWRSHRIMDVPVGDELVGRVIDALGRPLDGQGRIDTYTRLPMERPAPAIMDRAPVSTPLQTGTKAIDALIPIGRGQRELILGDRQIGKTAVAIDTILNQKKEDVICIYCSIGKESASVAKVIYDLNRYGAMEYTIVVIATGEDTPGKNYIVPYAATSIGEYFMEKGRDVLIVYDDLTRHARSYRELSLLLRRPPAREAYPGDIFYIHSRLLERSTHLKEDLGGGSLTALPIIETQAQNIAAYIPTNLVSITDGQIYLSPKLFDAGYLPAIDVGKSVSRVGGKTQLPAYREIAGDMRLSYSQFEELESFSRFGARLDEDTRNTLERGRRVREILKQDQYQPVSVLEQITVMLAVTEGVFDKIPMDKISQAKNMVREEAVKELSKIGDKIKKGEELDKEDKDRMLKKAQEAVEPLVD